MTPSPFHRLLSRAFSTARPGRLVLILALSLAGFGIALASLTTVESAITTRTLDRDLEPVIVTGTVVSAYENVPVDEFFVYAYDNASGGWTQIPAQVDEITASGNYTDTEDLLLDGDDEIVFMAMDLGDQAPEGPMDGGQPVSDTWYEIEVTDPISPTRKGWAYLVHSPTLTTTFTSDYVDFDSDLHRINATTHSMGFAATHPFYEYLAFAGTGVDILDRNKFFLNCNRPRLGCPWDEEMLPGPPDNLIKDGPVRVIVRKGAQIAYGSLLVWTINDPLLSGDLRFSTDFDPVVSGAATLYNAVVPGGVPVDGIPDIVPTAPLSNWWQLSHTTGTVIQVADTSAIGGTQTNYYVDDSAVDPDDTGDQRHYGETGVFVANPGPYFTVLLHIYFLPASQPNLGETYAGYFNQPLSVAAQLQQLPTPTPTPTPTLTPTLTPTPTPTPTLTPTPTPTPVTVDDTSYTITYDGWYGAEDPLASGGGYRAARDGGQWLVHRTAPTDAISLTTYRGPDQGWAVVLIDGVNQGLLDLYAPAPQYQHIQEYSGLTPGPHAIVVYVLGWANPASAGTEVRVDGFVVNGVTIEDNDPAMIYKGWLGLTAPWAYGGGLRATVTTGDSVYFNFTGTQFTWITLRGPTAGQAEVIVDEGAPIPVDLSNPAWQVQYPLAIGGLAPGAHNVQIRALGGLVVFDAFGVP